MQVKIKCPQNTPTAGTHFEIVNSNSGQIEKVMLKTSNNTIIVSVKKENDCLVVDIDDKAIMSIDGEVCVH